MIFHDRFVVSGSSSLYHQSELAIIDLHDLNADARPLVRNDDTGLPLGNAACVDHTGHRAAYAASRKSVDGSSPAEFWVEVADTNGLRQRIFPEDGHTYQFEGCWSQPQ